MRTVQEIYDAYRIMPWLQEHQLRVAATASLIAQNLTVAIDTESVVLACLFHDMANIIKSDFAAFPQLFTKESAAHWEEVKQDFIRKYGDNEHDAAMKIAAEIGLPTEVRKLIDGISFSKLLLTRDHASFEQKIVEYSDLRVAPYGITSMHERLAEAKKRYATESELLGRTEEEYQTLLRAAEEIERQIFAECRILPEDITEKIASPIMRLLRERSVESL